MKNENKDTELEQWFSTYGLLTAERILGRFNIRFEHKDLISAVKNPHNVYYKLLRIPLKHVYTGIIMQQATDYQSYTQKLFVGYLLSGEADKPEDAPGASVRESLEEERDNLKRLNDEFSEHETTHKRLIADSQASLISLAKGLQQALQAVSEQVKKTFIHDKSVAEIKKSMQSAIAHYPESENNMLAHDSSFWASLSEKLGHQLDNQEKEQLSQLLQSFLNYSHELDQALEGYREQCDDMLITIRNMRTQFYDMILRVNELLSNLPDYRPNPDRLEENLEALQFNAHLGE
ncbi:hypothetical protein [Legionella impletisoli]|uniref:Uncharacterized protein n=1 Tax=Legionella impletisoli TaxID=343510 RepID=A0A917JP55_9GAMM|nr:hypothetical protein [Legionella impletisoli]GGI76186.1 hypothetical protein GCM10007966_01290 [Legionella impletisoli]